MADFFLPHHVYFCYRGDAVVFLDLQRDDYTFVGAAGAAALRGLASLESGMTTPEQRAALKELFDGGLLTTDRNAGRAIAPTTSSVATIPLLDDEAVPPARLSAGHVWNFFAASTMAAARLRWGRLQETIARVQRRKVSRTRATSLDVDRARELVAIFGRLRSFFPRRYLCLYDSLALIEFLARYEIFPSWIFGVRLEPWAAHCWVQEAGLIFNETVEEAAGYTPVMAI
jgi:hypothetical protein